jgi:hypothetical protein
MILCYAALFIKASSRHVLTRGYHHHHHHHCMQAVPWLKRLVAGLSPRMPGFVPRSVHFVIVVYTVALGHVCLRVIPFSPVSIIPSGLSIRMYHFGDEQQARW